MPKLKSTGMTTNWAQDKAWCPGCGLHRHMTGEHRADCTAFEPECSECLYYLNVHGQHRPDCTKARTLT